MSEMDGEEAIHILRKRINPKIPIFALTTALDLSRYDALGFNEV